MLETVKSMQVLAFVSVYLMARKLLQYFVKSEKTCQNMALVLGKYWFCEDKTFFTDCTTLFCTHQYDFVCMKTLQFFKHFHDSSVLRKNRVFSEIRKIFAFPVISEKSFLVPRWFLIKRLITLYLSDQVWLNWFFCTDISMFCKLEYRKLVALVLY